MKRGLSYQLRLAAPALCLLVLLGMMLSSKSARIPQQAIDAYHKRITDAAARIPYKIGDWIGHDVPVSEPAQKLLKPNVLFQREYKNLITSRVMTVMLVHCGYIRDMAGHYPPVCYPAHGWQATGSTAESLNIDNVPQAVRKYSFVKSLNGRKRILKVTDFFVIPSKESPIIYDLNQLRSLGERRDQNELGVAQIQILTSGDIPDDERAEAVDAVLYSLEPVIIVIGDGIQ